MLSVLAWGSPLPTVITGSAYRLSTLDPDLSVEVTDSITHCVCMLSVSLSREVQHPGPACGHYGTEVHGRFDVRVDACFGSAADHVVEVRCQSRAPNLSKKHIHKKYKFKR